MVNQCADGDPVAVIPARGASRTDSRHGSGTTAILVKVYESRPRIQTARNRRRRRTRRRHGQQPRTDPAN
jgi:hypothetical protein